LKDELNDSVAVLNAGVLSYSPLLSRLLFAGVVEKYDPTLVILLLDPTDIGDDYEYKQQATIRGDDAVFDVEERRTPGSYGAVHELLRPYLERLIHPVADRQRYPYYAFELEIGGTIERNRFFIYRHPLALTRPYFSNTLDNIDRLAERVAGKGATFVLVISPRFHHWNRAEAPSNWERMFYELDEPYQFEYFRFFNEAGEMRDYRILDLLPAFKATEEAPLVFDSDPHWNEHGHEFVARTLARYLLNERAFDR
jgi:hypothetical protein